MYTISLFLFYVFPQVSCLVELLEDFLLTIFSHLILSDINIQFTKSKCGFHPKMPPGMLSDVFTSYRGAPKAKYKRNE